MSEAKFMVDRVAEAIARVAVTQKTPNFHFQAIAAIEAMRELPGDPGPRYNAGEYSRRTQDAMVDDALGKVDA
jgi:hypothetical protein